MVSRAFCETSGRTWSRISPRVELTSGLLEDEEAGDVAVGAPEVERSSLSTRSFSLAVFKEVAEGGSEVFSGEGAAGAGAGADWGRAGGGAEGWAMGLAGSRGVTAVAAGEAASRRPKNFGATKTAVSTMAAAAPRMRLRELDPGDLWLVAAGSRASSPRGICSLGSGGTGESGTANGDRGAAGFAAGASGTAARAVATAVPARIGAAAAAEEATTGAGMADAAEVFAGGAEGEAVEEPVEAGGAALVELGFRDAAISAMDQRFA